MKQKYFFFHFKCLDKLFFLVIYSKENTLSSTTCQGEKQRINSCASLCNQYSLFVTLGDVYEIII